MISLLQKVLHCKKNFGGVVWSTGRFVSRFYESNVVIVPDDIKDEEYLNEALQQDLQVIENFIGEEEEESLLQEIEKALRRTKYQYDHWDGAIHGFRETEKSNWNDANQLIIKKIEDVAFDKSKDLIPATHILDLADNGHIKPHTDSVKFCGSTIAGLNLLSSAVMRYERNNVNEDNSDDSNGGYVDVLLPRLSLYIMKDRLRYDFTHEILGDEQSYWRGEHLPRHRRVSVLLRNEPA